MTGINKGSHVEWQWGKGKATGKVEERFTEKVEKKIKGKTITRNASKEEPAYLVKQEKGTKAIKSDSELKKTS